MKLKLVRDNDDPKLLADLERLARRSADPALEAEGEPSAAPAAAATSAGSRRARRGILRTNDDPKLLADLERLAGGEPGAAAAGAATAAAAAEAADEDDDTEAGPLDDPFVRRFVLVSVHLKRYAPFYAGAAVWLFAMLLIQPVGRNGASTEVAGGPGFAGTATANVATASADTAVADLNADAIGAPVFETVTGAAAFSEGDSAFGDFTESEFSSGSLDSGSDTTATTSPTFDDSETITFDDTEFGSDEEEQGLTIVRSGYASRTGGTPLEQDPPGGALPVAVTAGNDSKRSFLQLSGTGAVLRLKESPDGAVQPEAAVLKACVATSEWKAERGQAFDAGPTFDPACSTGARFDGVWSFDLSTFPAEELARGLVLTGGPGTAHTFEVRLEPTPLDETTA